MTIEDEAHLHDGLIAEARCHHSLVVCPRVDEDPALDPRAPPRVSDELLGELRPPRSLSERAVTVGLVRKIEVYPAGDHLDELVVELE
jgi:hypothetical protein